MRTPIVGDTVIFFNRHGFPRAAIVTGTLDSLEGEQHVELIDDSSRVHLHILSPLPRQYGLLNVPHVSKVKVQARNPERTVWQNCWQHKDEYDAEIRQLRMYRGR